MHKMKLKAVGIGPIYFGPINDWYYDTKPPASVAQVTETQCAPTGKVYRRSRGSILGSAGRFCVQITGVHALRLISQASK